MRRILCILAAVSSIARADPAADRRIKDLEARVKVLEDTLAHYRDAIDFLQRVYEEQQRAAARDEIAPDGTFAVAIADDVRNGQVLGTPGAGVTIVWAFDFACPYCNRARAIVDELLAKYKGKVRVVLKNLVVHTQLVMSAHVVGCAAGKQHKFVEFFAAFFDGPFQEYVATHQTDVLDEDHAIAIARQHGVDVAKLRGDLAACRTFIASDMAELAKFKVEATPSFFINGKPYQWDGTAESFYSVIDEQLALVAKSKIAPAKYYDAVVMKGERAFRAKADPKP